MNWKRFLGATVAAWLGILVLDAMINGIFLAGDFEATAGHWLPSDELFRRIPLGWLSMLLSVVLFGYVFIRFGDGCGARNGLRFALWIGTALAAPGPLGLYALVPWPMKMILAWSTQWFINMVVIGLMFGWIYRPGPGKAASRGALNVAS
jgi:hypothetical protein